MKHGLSMVPSAPDGTSAHVCTQIYTNDELGEVSAGEVYFGSTVMR